MPKEIIEHVLQGLLKGTERVLWCSGC